MKKLLPLLMLTFVFVLLVAGCSAASNESDNICDKFNDEVAEKTSEEWADDYKTETYEPNNEIKGEYDKNLSAKCENGVFVGLKTNDVISWKGISYSQQPVGSRRFCSACDPEPSDNVYEAYHYGHTCMQPVGTGEDASKYEQGEDCLNLNVWSNTTNSSASKPVLVFIHGGGFNYGGSADPLYDGYNFSNYNSEVILVTINYRVGILGNFNTSMFPDAQNYPTSINNGVLDAVQALKWINNNIAAFGGDPENVTLLGESAGACNLSHICTMAKANGYVKRYVPMSGGVGITSDVQSSTNLGEALKKEFGVKTVNDVVNIPYDDLCNFWIKNVRELETYIIRDGNIIPQDPLAEWENGASSDVSLMSGRVGNEFRLYKLFLGNSEELYTSLCKAMDTHTLQNSGDTYKQDRQLYYDILSRLGYAGDDLYKQYANDKYFNCISEYQAYLHAKNGGDGYYYIFNAKYDNPSDIGAGHAIDCYYLFGNFDGKHVFGTVDQQKLSRVFQKAMVNYATYGDPSIDWLNWPKFDNASRKTMVFEENNVSVQENPEKERTDIVIKMCQDSFEFRYTPPLMIYYPYLTD